MALSKEQRDALPDDDFAVPGKRVLPIHDDTHIRMAWNMVDRTHGLTTEERSAARSRILRRAKEKGVDTADWHKIAAMVFDPETVRAMSLYVPLTPDHPNKVAFSGVLTKVNEPSDAPPNGSGGKRVMLPATVAEKALATLLGMAIDFTPDLDGHDEKRKVGVITAAHIEGNDLLIEGFFYAADFPQEVARIRADKTVMGFSFEAQRIFVEDLEADPLVISDCVFTGAAVLRKDKAAYRSTSLAASAAGAHKELDMTPEEMKALLGDAIAAAIAPVTAQVTALAAKVDEVDKGIKADMNCAALVEPHSKALHAAADAMEKSGLGNDPRNGHVAVVRRVANHMMAEAHMGRMPTIYRDHDYGYAAGAAPIHGETLLVDPATKALTEKVEALTAAGVKKDAELASLTTTVTDLKAASSAAGAAPERRTMSPSITALLSRSGIAAPAEGGKLDRGKVMHAMKASGVEPAQRIQVEIELDRAGQFEATA